MTRQNYYARRKLRRRRRVDGELVAQLVQRERCLQPRLGARKLRVLLQEPLAEAKVQLGRDRFFEVLREHDLLLGRRRLELHGRNHRRQGGGVVVVLATGCPCRLLERRPCRGGRKSQRSRAEATARA